MDHYQFIPWYSDSSSMQHVQVSLNSILLSDLVIALECTRTNLGNARQILGELDLLHWKLTIQIIIGSPNTILISIAQTKNKNHSRLRLCIYIYQDERKNLCAVFRWNLALQTSTIINVPNSKHRFSNSSVPKNQVENIFKMWIPGLYHSVVWLRKQHF